MYHGSRGHPHDHLLGVRYHQYQGQAGGRQQGAVLAGRCGDIVQTLRDVMSRADKAISLRVGSLQTLLSTLTAVEQFITHPRFNDINKDGLSHWLMEVYFSSEDRVKFRELNDALTQNIMTATSLSGRRTCSSSWQSESKDRRTMERSLLEVLGGEGVNVDDASAVGAFLRRHQQIKSIIEGLPSIDSVYEGKHNGGASLYILTLPSSLPQQV